MKEQSKGKYTPEQMNIITTRFAKGATDTEIQELLYKADLYGLDVIIGEIYCIKKGTNDAQIYAGKNGYLKIAHASGQLDGIETGTNGSIKNGDLSGWCRIFRKDMGHEFYATVDYSEYNSGYGIWNTKPKTMITKVAQSHCLRLAFNVSGLYEVEEMDLANVEIDKKIDAKKSNSKKIVMKLEPEIQAPDYLDPGYKDPVFEPMTKNQKELLRAIAKSKGFESNKDIKDYAFKEFKILDLNIISFELCNEIIERLRSEKIVKRVEQFDMYDGSPLEVSESERHRLQK